MTAEIIRPPAFQRRQQAALEEAPRRTAEQIALIGRANVIVADALGVARMHSRCGNKVAARERLVTAARDLARLDPPLLPEVVALIETMFKAAREVRPHGRGFRQRPGSNVGRIR